MGGGGRHPPYKSYLKRNYGFSKSECLERIRLHLAILFLGNLILNAHSMTIQKYLEASLEEGRHPRKNGIIPTFTPSSQGSAHGTHKPAPFHSRLKQVPAMNTQIFPDSGESQFPFSLPLKAEHQLFHHLCLKSIN